MNSPELTVVRVVRGDPTPEEVAALIAVLHHRTSSEAQPSRPHSAWSDPASLLRAPLPRRWR